jgi:hypothetical protein
LNEAIIRRVSEDKKRKIIEMTSGGRLRKSGVISVPDRARVVGWSSASSDGGATVTAVGSNWRGSNKGSMNSSSEMLSSIGFSSLGLLTGYLKSCFDYESIIA